MPLTFQVAEFRSPEYDQAIELRTEVLRKPLGMVYTPEQLEAESDQLHLVGLLEGDVVAVALLQPLNAHTAKMRQVAVRPDLQGQGIGRQLAAFFEQQCLERGIAQIELHARRSAIPFYEALGYACEGDWYEEVGIPHKTMKKTLTP